MTPIVYNSQATKKLSNYQRLVSFFLYVSYIQSSGNRLKARDLFFSGVATHFVESREVCNIILVHNIKVLDF